MAAGTDIAMYAYDAVDRLAAEKHQFGPGSVKLSLRIPCLWWRAHGGSMRKVIWLAALLFVFGCEPSPSAPMVERRQLTGDVVKLSQQISGYKGTSEAMNGFLECWNKEVNAHMGGVEGAVPALRAIAEFDPRLPRSARQFFDVSGRGGFRSLYERTVSDKRFADPTNLRLFKEAYPNDFNNWLLAFGDIDEPDATYYRYDKDQAPMRGRYLPNMLVLGHEEGGAFYLLIQEEKSADGENEVLFLHHGGLIVRFKSFAHLLVHLYLEEHEKMAGRDPAHGHLYFFPGNIAETCARFVLKT
jgi:hypothetical protein